MNRNSIVNNLVKKSLLMFLSIIMTGIFCIGTVYSEKQNSEENKEIEVLYYDKSSGIKIIKKDNFLLKVVKNEKGLNIFHELGFYPEAYPADLPEPKTHIDDE